MENILFCILSCIYFSNSDYSIYSDEHIHELNDNEIIAYILKAMYESESIIVLNIYICKIYS